MITTVSCAFIVINAQKTVFNYTLLTRTALFINKFNFTKCCPHCPFAYAIQCHLAKLIKSCKLD